jgi:hypothetical protein
MADERDQTLVKLENITNDYYNELRELMYQLDHFIHKSNSSTALNARNAFRDVNKLAKDFKDISILFFDKG